MKNKKQILIAIPHASTYVPADLRKLMNLTDKEIRQASDLYTDKIFEVPNAYTVKAGISRLVADPNRAPDDIEAECRLNHEGVVVSVDEFGKQIHEEPPPIDEVFARVAKYHEPFHQKIEKLTPKIKFLIDGHSLLSVGPEMRDDPGNQRADIVLGNRGYTTCSRDITIKIAKYFEGYGLSVAVNKPYPGKYVLGYHCSRRGLPGVQVEINRKLFMNEKSLRPRQKDIKKMNQMIFGLVELINAWI